MFSPIELEIELFCRGVVRRRWPPSAPLAGRWC